METMLDLLDLYTHYQKQSIVGPLHNIEKFISIRIKINQELEEKKLPRHTEFYELPRNNGMRHTPKTPITPASPTDVRFNGNMASPAAMSPKSAGSGKRGAGVRGQDGTVRFMLDTNTAKDERDTVNEYFRDEYEDYEVEVEEAVPVEPVAAHHGNGRGPHDGRHGHGHGRDYRHFNHKRMRR
jgi:CTD kinase subunit beta